MEMTMKEFYELCKSGKSPVIEMGDNIHEYLEESFDPKMVGRVINASIEDEDSYRFLIDMNGYEEHNKSVAQYDWRDSKGDLTLSWFETKYYPEDGIEEVHFTMSGNTPFKLLSGNLLFSEYLESNVAMSYVEWLENKVNQSTLVVRSNSVKK